MAVAPERNELALLKRLVPLNTLPDQDLQQLLHELRIEQAKRGEFLFREGDTDHQSVYLLAGQVALVSGKAEVDQVSAGTDMARFPIAHQIPRKFSVRARSPVEFVRIDSRLISERLARRSQDAYEVSDLRSESSTGEDWMTQLLQSRVFQQIPAANIQRVMMAMEEMQTKAEDLVIRQGDEGDYFYLIHKGRCAVTRDMRDGKGPVEVAQLGPGDSFGEEALLSDKPRNSNVVMLTDGVLLRLSKPHFVTLVKRPLARTLSFEEAKARVTDGAVWLDVRPAAEYEAGHLDGSVNLPFASLRYQAPSLAPNRHYVAYCQDGRTSSAAAYLLTDRGFEVSVMDGGLRQAGPDAFVQGLRKTEPEAPAPAAEGASAALQGEIGVLRKRLDEAASRMAEMARGLEKAAADRQRVADQHDHDVAAFKQLIDQAKHQIRSDRGARDQSLAQAKEQEQHLKALGEKLEQMEQALAASKKETKAAQRDYARQIESARAEWGSRVEGLERTLVEEKARASEVERGRAELQALVDRWGQEHDARVTELGQQLAGTRTALDAASEQRNALERELAQRAEDLKALARDRASEAEAAGSRYAEQQAELAEAQRRISELTQAGGDLEARLAGEGLRIEALEQEKASAASSAAARQAELEVELSAARQSLEELSEVRSALTDQAEEMAERLEAIESEKAREAEVAAALRADLARSESELEEQRAALAASRQEAEALGQLSGQLEEARGALDLVQRERGDLQARLESLQGDLRRVEEQRSAAESQAEEKAQSLVQEVDRLCTGLAEAEAQRRQAEEAGAAASARLQALESARGTQDEQLAGVTGELGEARSELVRLQGERADLAEKLGRVAEELAAAQEAARESAQRFEQAAAEREELQRALAEGRSQAERLEQDKADLAARVGAVEAEREAAIGEGAAAAQARDQEIERRTELERGIEAVRENLLQETETRVAFEQRLAILDEERQGIAAERESAVGRVGELEAALTERDRDLRLLKDRVETLEATAGEHGEAERELGVHKERIRDLERANADLSAELQAVNEQAQELLNRLAEQGKQHDKERRRLTAAEERSAQSKQELGEARAQLKAAEARIGKIEKRAEGLEGERDGALSQVAALETRLADDGSQNERVLSEVRAELAAAQTQLDALRDRGEEVEAERDRALAQVGDLEGRLNDLASQDQQARSEAQARLDAAVAGAAELRDRIEEVTHERDQALSRIGELEGREEQVATRAQDALRSELEAARDRLVELDRALSETVQERDQSRQAQAELEARLQAQEAADEVGDAGLQEARLQVGQLEAEREGLRETLDDLESQMVASGLRVEGLEQQIKALEAEKAAAQADRDTFAARIDELESAAARGQTQGAQGAREAGELSAALTHAEQETARLRAELERLQAGAASVDAGAADLAEFQSLRQELEDARASLQETQIEIDDLVKERHALEDRLEDDNGKLEALAQEAEHARQDMEEAAYQRKEAEDARRQVEEAMYRLQEQLDTTRGDLARAERSSARAGSSANIGSNLRAALAGGLVGMLLVALGGAGWLAWTGKLELPGELGARLAAQRGSELSRGGVSTKPGAAETAPLVQPGASLVSAGSPAAAAAEPLTPAGEAEAAPSASKRRELQEPSAPVLVRVQGGEFTMGNNNGPLSPDERPEHRVRVRDFYIGRYEVTFAEYDRFARATGRRLPDDHGWGRGNRPVVDVSWEDAVAYTEWLSRQTGAHYRLPSEAEWEYAAAAGTHSFYWWGYDMGKNHANCFNCGSRWDGVQTAPVGSFAPNAYGLYDTAGNVAEWVEDCYRPSYEGAPTDGAAWQDGDKCEKRVLRGGAFNRPAANLQTTSRAAQPPTNRLPGAGFRVARDLR